MERNTGKRHRYTHSRAFHDALFERIPLTKLATNYNQHADTSAGITPKINATSTENWPRTKRQRILHDKFLARLCRPLSNMSWRSGLYAGLYASILVLLSNVALLLTGLVAHHGDVSKGVRTIVKGDVRHTTFTSTTYHVLINVLSTILLTSSNYTMQILCAPTRDDINRAHARGKWLEIGIMSVHNLRHIGGKRVVIWSLLAFSSAPLHLL
jgi:hypothetical protein